jgi:hypothetical protein
MGRGELGVLPEVVVLLTLCSPPGSNNSDAFFAFRIGYEQKIITRCLANENKTILATIFTVIKTFDGKRVGKHRLGQLKTHAMSLNNGIRLGIVPFEFHWHNTTESQ